MNCAEFQKVLPYIIETGGNADEERHLRDCPVCSDLVADLRYIAEQAKLLVPMEDPSPRVWEGIRESLEREGMIKPGRARGRLLGPIPWISAIGAMVLIAFGAFLVERGHQQVPGAEAQPSAAATLPASNPRADWRRTAPPPPPKPGTPRPEPRTCRARRAR